ncbi:hypothetical protein BJ508DRAFT_409955 [Ascobolus immersus RN42]|uniref:Calcium channel YVC1-like C-terminal transmembrane domain-containing protein n=1 Tax=Ascobolus immersus RN42 TaxID=1160509 RepID=A0A3N4J2D1_ASCIM|nr:hypothetical protein BJ508DRAFT_409955 [Ascobolus immersus RN42]
MRQSQKVPSTPGGESIDIAFPFNRPPSLQQHPGVLFREVERRLLRELEIDDSTTFVDLAKIFRAYIREHVDGPYTLQQLRTLPALAHLGMALSERCYNTATVAALLWCRIDFSASSHEEERYGVNESRSLACEIIAVDALSCLSEVDLVQYLCYEAPVDDDDQDNTGDESDVENSGLLSGDVNGSDSMRDQDLAPGFAGLNALEMAIVAEAKYFISMRTVQRVVDGIWSGHIVFWESLNVTGRKKAHIYNPKKADPFSRLRAPRYQKVFEALFFSVLLGLYYAVLIERNPTRLTLTEGSLILFFLAFAYDEFSQWADAGTMFYVADIWSWLDLAAICMFTAHLICRIIGLVKRSEEIIDNSFDILSLTALILVPRLCSLLSLHPYFGVLIPCLKQMTKDSMKFGVLVVILYVGFLSTFTILGRDNFTLGEMSILMLRVFFGATGVGFDAMKAISPILGPPLMFIFVVLTNILLITSLISLLSNSLNTLMDNAREEYLFMYSTFVLESVTSNRLTHFYPPLNLIPLFLLRPLRLFLSSEQLRGVRILLLKLTHFPFVAAIMAFEHLTSTSKSATRRSFFGPGHHGSHSASGRSSVLSSQVQRRRSQADKGVTNRRAPLQGRDPENRPNDGSTTGQFTPRILENDRVERSQAMDRQFERPGDSGPSVDNAEMRRLKDMLEVLTLKVDTLLATKNTQTVA